MIHRPRRPSLDIPTVPIGLWSLWDMIRFQVKPLLDMQDVLVQLSIVIHSEDSRVFPKMGQRSRDDVLRHLAALMPELQSPGFELCRKAADRLQRTLEETDESKRLVQHIDDLRGRLLDQVDLTYCLLLNEKERELYEPEKPPFGAEVEASFPSANEDIYEACRCLAVGRATACVMHLMRACEVALIALAGALQVQRQDDWGGYIRQITDALEKRVKASGKRSAEEYFYAEAAIGFEHLKRAWRNPTMHVDKTYSPERAGEILDAVKSFMAHLAPRIHEPRHIVMSANPGSYGLNG